MSKKVAYWPRNLRLFKMGGCIKKIDNCLNDEIEDVGGFYGGKEDKAKPLQACLTIQVSVDEVVS